jgi:hypothetical protein
VSQTLSSSGGVSLVVVVNDTMYGWIVSNASLTNLPSNALSEK